MHAPVCMSTSPPIAYFVSTSPHIAYFVCLMLVHAGISLQLGVKTVSIEINHFAEESGRRLDVRGGVCGQRELVHVLHDDDVGSESDLGRE